MLISHRWLNEMLGCSLDPTGEHLQSSADERGGQIDLKLILESMTGLGLEVERSTSVGLGMEKVIVAEVQHIGAHPNSDRLHLVQLRIGAERELANTGSIDGSSENPSSITVVCGAQNLPNPGGKVTFVPVGARLPNGMEIAEREVRGVVSRGMICSEAELEIGADSDGILILPEHWEAGDRLIDRVPTIVDDIIEISVTPNRPDALGHIGVARDLAVKLGYPLEEPKQFEIKISKEIEELVDLQDRKCCGRYLGVALSGVEIKASPLWMRVRLHHLGLRAINNIVDISNYVLMEYGHPTHAFDRDHLANRRVVIRAANDGELLQTLDDRKVELSSSDLVIADGKKPQALAGVMGGKESMVGPSTTEVLLETAWFAPTTVHRSAKRHGFHTDSSHRFERGVDFGSGLNKASARAVYLAKEYAQARVVGKCEAKGELPEIAAIQFRPSRVKRLLGIEIAPDRMEKIFKGLGVQVDKTKDSSKPWACVPPSFRPDLNREVDLIEEVMRHYGLDEVPAIAIPPSSIAARRPPVPRNHLAEQCTELLRAVGMNELVSVAFAPEECPTLFSQLEHHKRRVHLKNPLGQHASTLRFHLLPGLLTALRFNWSRHERPARFFEIGRVYRWPGDKLDDSLKSFGIANEIEQVDSLLPKEPVFIGMLWADRTTIPVSEKNSKLTKNQGQESASENEAKSIAQVMIAAAKNMGYTIRPGNNTLNPCPILHPGVQASWKLDQRTTINNSRSEAEQPIGWTEVGVFGEVHPDILEAWDISEQSKVYYSEICLDLLPESRPPSFIEIPRFPATDRDLSLEIPDLMSVETVISAIEEAAVLPSLNSDFGSASGSNDDGIQLVAGDSSGRLVDPLEVYRGASVESGRKAILLRLHYRAAHRSVTDDEVQPVHDKIVEIACIRLSEGGNSVVRR